MATTTFPSGEITGQVLFYSNPEPVDPDRHGKLGIKAMDHPFAFAAKTNLIPLTVTEFENCAMSYPIIFVGPEYTPVAVMGLKEGENQFITPEGQIDPLFYLPAYIRRYPFVFANDAQAQRMVLCLDGGSYIFDPNGGELPLFKGREPTEYLNSAMEFCRAFETERLRTENFVKLLKELDLFDVKQAHFTPRLPNGGAGPVQVLAEYYAVAPEKLQTLSDAKIAELWKSGALMAIHAHMMSLGAWDRLVGKAIVAAQAAGLPSPV